ncbi:MAG: sulfotransferase [Candidatus Krumholzibacteria bacterium]|nr:sulfotransferase [Candidatus Krumholzibacteria bacterium]
MIFVVLGMHKSGTTVVSQILHFSGINMGDFDSDVHYDKGNKYEREDSLDLGLDILGTDSYDVLDLAGDPDTSLSEAQRSRMKAIIAQCDTAHDNWGIKDPRMCLTYRLWAEELPAHKLIIVYRDPAQVWPRFKWMGKRKYLTNFNRAYSYLHRWQEHNRNILEFLQESPQQKIVLSYHELMSGNKEFERLQAFVGQQLTDRRKPELYRTKSGQDIFIKFADWLLARKTGQSTGDTIAQLGAARARELD